MQVFREPRLLSGNLLVGFPKLTFERTYACDIDPIRRANHMREHVHLTESILNKGPIGSRMGQNSPIAAGNIALFERFKPEPSQLRGARCFRKASNSCLMALIQCLV